MDSKEILEDKYGAVGYDPGLYAPTQIAKTVDGFDGVTDSDVALFHEQGYLAIDHAYAQGEVDGAMAAVSELIGGQNDTFKGVQFEKGVRGQAEDASGETKEKMVRKLTRFVGFDLRLDCLAENQKLLNILTKIMGEQPKLFANQAMLKPPGIGREKPWHQDHAYFNLPLDTCIVSAWIALDNASPENGCMHVIPGSQLGGPIVHFNRRDWQICDTDVMREQITAVPLRPGGVLLWHGRLHHGTPANQSDKRRRALQLHYVPTSAETIDQSLRLSAFGSEGKDVTC